MCARYPFGEVSPSHDLLCGHVIWGATGRGVSGAARPLGPVGPGPRVIGKFKFWPQSYLVLLDIFFQKLVLLKNLLWPQRS